MELTQAQIDSLAPDPASIKAGKGLATFSKWKNLGASETALWGECQGSGANPYKSQLDTTEFVFKCTCPSRKFPCKHSLGLMYLFASNNSNFSNPMPDWVKEWLDSRETKKQKQEEKKEKPKEIDPEKKAKTEAKRTDTIKQGLDDLELWLSDFVRRGFDSIKVESYSFFNQMAGRMVDYKASGLARRIKELSSLSATGQNNELLLKKISNIYLLIKAFRNLENLPELVQEDIKTQIGITKLQDEVLTLDGIKDTWFVLGNSFEEEENLRTKKTFVFGLNTKKIAMILDFSIAKKPFTNIDLLAGAYFEGEIVYYPSNFELRGLFKNKNPLTDFSLPKLFGNTEMISALYSSYAESLSKNPFVEKIPCFISNVGVSARTSEYFVVYDKELYFIPISKKFSEPWELIMKEKGEKITLFGEFDGTSFLPICAFNPEEFMPFLRGNFI